MKNTKKTMIYKRDSKKNLNSKTESKPELSNLKFSKTELSKTKVDGTGKELKLRRKLTKREKIFLIVPAVAVLVFALVLVLVTRDVYTYKFEEDASQYYAGNAFKINANTELYRNNEGVSVVRVDGEENEMDSLPIYLNNGRTLFPQDMVYCNPRSSVYKKLIYFTEVSVNGDLAEAFRDGDSVELNRGFLYDGNDIYYLLEPMVLSFNGYKIELSANSYIEAVYTGEVMIFNRADRSTFSEIPQGDAIIESLNGEYTVSLLGDFYTLQNGEKWLLFTRPDLLESVI